MTKFIKSEIFSYLYQVTAFLKVELFWFNFKKIIFDKIKIDNLYSCFQLIYLKCHKAFKSL